MGSFRGSYDEASNSLCPSSISAEHYLSKYHMDVIPVHTLDGHDGKDNLLLPINFGTENTWDVLELLWHHKRHHQYLLAPSPNNEPVCP